MKKAVVIGGSNGIGLAISLNLIDRGYSVKIMDLVAPDENLLEKNIYQFEYCNLMDFQDDQFETLAQDQDISLLMITAGVGRIADFECFHISEIEKILTVDMLSTLKILKIFYKRIKCDSDFYCGVMGSISGWVSSPMAAVYAAAKAGLVRFIESVNIELEVAGVSNRILDVSPGSIKGTKFNGGSNQLELLTDLADQIIVHVLRRDCRWIPQYEEIFKEVMRQYQTDPHSYGLHSYLYKKQSGRASGERRSKIGYLSGTFDLFHIGHLNLLRRAKEQCDYLIVGVHESGAWKGKETFIPFDERKAIVSACRYVDKVVTACKEDSEAWQLWNINRLFVGSDYKGTPRFQRYEEFFADKDVEIVYFPYTESTNSTQIRNAIKMNTSQGE